MKDARLYLIRKAIEEYYVAPNPKERLVGLTEFIDDLSQRSFHLANPLPQPTIARQEMVFDQASLREDHCSIHNVIHTITLENINDLRPNKPSAYLQLLGSTISRYVHLAMQFNLEEFNSSVLASNFLNLVGLQLIVPGAWPNKLQGMPEGMINIPEYPPSAFIPEKLDISDRSIYMISNSAWQNLHAMADLSKTVKHKRLGPFLDSLSYCEFVDKRYGEAEPGYMKLAWGDGSRRLPRTITLPDSARQRFVTVAQEFGIHPTTRYTDAAITGAVLEAIGLKYLVPTTIPTNMLLHGPSFN